MKWILKVDTRIWISDTNCSENIRRNECLVYHWTKFISFDTLELTLVQTGAVLPVHVKRYNGFNFLHSVCVCVCVCVCVFCKGTCQTELIQGPLEILWLKCMHNSSWGPCTRSNGGGCCCCFLYSWNKMILDWYFVHFNLGEDQKNLCKFCSSPLKLKQLKFRSKEAGPGSNESRFPQPSTWMTPRRP